MTGGSSSRRWEGGSSRGSSSKAEARAAKAKDSLGLRWGGSSDGLCLFLGFCSFGSLLARVSFGFLVGKKGNQGQKRLRENKEKRGIGDCGVQRCLMRPKQQIYIPCSFSCCSLSSASLTKSDSYVNTEEGFGNDRTG